MAIDFPKKPKAPTSDAITPQTRELTMLELQNLANSLNNANLAQTYKPASDGIAALAANTKSSAFKIKRPQAAVETSSTPVLTFDPKASDPDKKRN